VEFSIKIDTEAFQASLDKVSEDFTDAFAATKNMIASMIKTASDADIRAAGNFGDMGVTVEVDGDTIRTTLDDPRGNIFEDGGTIHGNPLLWLPLSGTDAEGIRAGEYPGGLFSVNRKAGGVPLLFSVADRAPKYFGIESVNIPKKFHLADIQTNVMANFQQIFKDALGNG
jgi:hypothetical protein